MSKLRVGIALLAFCLYLAIPTKNYYWDGISFAQAIETAQHWPTLFHPNHLLYNVVGWVCYQALGGSFRALYVLQALNALFAALTVYVMSGIASQLTESRTATLVLSAAFAFSGTWWRFSTDADAYILSVLLLTVCAHLLLVSKDPHPLTVAFIHTGAMLIHELAFLFVPAVLFLLWKRRPRDAALYCGTAGPTTLAAYALAFHLQTGRQGFSEFAAWTASHAGDVTFSFRLISNAEISLRSWLQLFFVGRPSIVRYTDPSTIVLLVISGALLLLLLVRLPQAWRKSGLAVRLGQTTPFHFSLIWLAAYALFLLVWLPNNTFYKLFALPPLIIALAACWKPRTEMNFRHPAVLAVALMAFFNLTFAIIPYSRETANAAIEFALALRQPLKGNSIVYFNSFNTDDWFARYFTPTAQWKQLGRESEIDADLRSGKAVWLETTALDLFSTLDRQWLNRRLIGAKWYQLLNAKHHIRFVRLTVQPG